MADTTLHLVQSVLPEVPVRHWVCSFPWGVRAVLGYDRELCRAAMQAFAKEVSRSLKRRAKQELAVVQRTSNQGIYAEHRRRIRTRDDDGNPSR